METEGPRHDESSPARSGFEVDAEPVLRELGAALRGLLMPDGREVRASEVTRSLGVASVLAWQAVRVASAEDCFAEVAQIPRQEPMAKLLGAAAAAAYPKGAVDRASAAYRAFEALVSRHAGSRGSFDAMAAGLGRGAGERTELPARRAAFRANAQLWGFQAGLVYKCMVVAPGPAWRTNPLVIVRGARSLRALRRVRSIPLGKREFVSVGQGVEFGKAPGDRQGAVLLEDFCSPGLPAIEPSRGDGSGHDFLNLPQIGMTGAVDVFMAATTRCVNLASREIGVATVMHTPCEEFIADLVAPAGLWDPATLDAGVYACIEDVSRARTLHPDYRVPCAAQAERLGRSIDALHDGSFPRCPELVRSVLRVNGWGRDEFDLFRFRIRYPLLHSCIALLVHERGDAPSAEGAARS